MSQAFAQKRAKSNGSFVVFQNFFQGNFSQPINQMQKTIGIFFGGKLMIDRRYFCKRPAQYVGGVCKGNFAFGQCQRFFLQNGFFQFLPIARNIFFVAHQNAVFDFVRFNKHKGQMCQHVVNIRTSAGNFNVHLFVVDAVAIASSFWRNNGREMRLRIPFV